MMKSPIYAITLLDMDSESSVIKKTEYVGFYHDINTCKEVLHDNAMDIQDGIYTNAFIFIVYPGLFFTSPPELREFFEWDAARQGFFEAEEPKDFEHIAFF